MAGHETSVNALSFALHFIAQDPAVASRMREEARGVLGDGSVRYGDVPRLRYTRQVINEALRLWPTAPGFFRSAKKDTQVGGYEFAAGEWVFVLLLAVQRDPAGVPTPTGSTRIASHPSTTVVGHRSCSSRSAPASARASAGSSPYTR